MDKLGILDSSDGEGGEEKLSPLDKQLDIWRNLETLSIHDSHFSEALVEQSSGQEESKDPTTLGDVWDSGCSPGKAILPSAVGLDMHFPSLLFCLKNSDFLDV